MSLTPRKRHLLFWSILIISSLVSILAYLQALNFPFISDDEKYITDNIRLSGLNSSELWRLFIERYNPFEFLPFRDLSYWFDIVLFGLTPSAFRAHNIILYLLCLLLIYAVTLGLWRYFRPEDDDSVSLVAATVTALFAIHPAHVEAVVWISGRKDVLSGLFSTLALLLAVKSGRNEGISPRYATASLFALLAAMLSKATAVAVAPVIAFLWVVFWRDIPSSKRSRNLLLWPLASLLLAVSVTLIFMKFSTIKEHAYFGIESYSRALSILGWMARLSLSPETRHFFYPVFEDTKLSIAIILGVFVLTTALAGFVLMLRKRAMVEGFALSTFLILCLPYTQFIPFKTISLVSDRFLFLAVWPVVLIIVAFAWRLNIMPRVILLLVIAISWSFQTIEHPSDLRSQEAYADSDFSEYPGHYQVAFQKIWLQLRVGKYDDAIVTANNVIEPNMRNILVGMVQATYAVRFMGAATGKPDDAMAALLKFEAALNHPPSQAKWNPSMTYVADFGQYILSLKGARLADQFPDDAYVRYKAGLWKLGVDNYRDAILNLQAAIESQRLPESIRGNAFKSIGIAMLKSGYAAEAEVPLRAALEQSPPDLQANCLLSEVYKQMGRPEDAARSDAICRNIRKQIQ